ncbi:MAG: zinc ribbon domain-containing protein [Gemmatimonadales bacterium]
MTDLERLAAAILTQWRAEGGADGAAIAVSALLERVLPYRVARRILGIDVSEDYEALVLRLLSEEDDLVRVEPVDAADMARDTIQSRLPDLDVLQLLRSATVTITGRTIARLDGVLPMPGLRDAAGPDPGTEVPDATPAGDEKVIPLRPDHEPRPVKQPASDPPPAFLTTVSFTAPAEALCWSCTERLPADRQVRFCPFCGADQRQPACAACGMPAERTWKHCPDCGAKL